MKHLFGRKKIEIVHRGVKNENKLFWGMWFEPGNAQPHLRIPEKTILRCIGSESPLEFLDEALVGPVQPMWALFEGNMRRMAIVPLAIQLTPEEAIFRFTMAAVEDDLTSRGYTIQDCPSSWGYGWSCVEPQRNQK